MVQVENKEYPRLFVIGDLIINITSLVSIEKKGLTSIEVTFSDRFNKSVSFESEYKRDRELIRIIDHIMYL